MAMSTKQIASLRKKLSLNLEQFGKLFGVSHSAVSLWEHGKRTPSAAVVILMQQKQAELAAKKNLQNSR